MLGRAELAGSRIYAAGGCKYCNQTGYTGRTGVFELLPFSEELARMVADPASPLDLDLQMRGDGRLLLDDGLDKLLAGSTTLEEILAVVHHGPAEA